MELLLSEQQSLLRSSATRLASTMGGPKRARELRTSGREIDTEAWTAIVAAGWLATLVRHEHDGMGLGSFDIALMIEETARQPLMVPLPEASAALWALSRATGGKPSPTMLRDGMAGNKLLLAATAAPTWRFPAGRPADRDADGGLHLAERDTVLLGRIDHVACAGSADAFVIDAHDGEGRCRLCIATRQHLAIGTQHNVDGSTSSRLTAPNTVLETDAVVATGATATGITAGMQELLVLLTSAELLGVAAAALDITTDYLKIRKQFGKPIGSFQALQHRVVDCFVDLELNRSMLYRVLASWDEGSYHPAMVSACKARLSRSALIAVRACLQLHGAIGYTDEHDIGLYYKRAVALAAKYGNEILHVDAFSALTTGTGPG